MSAFGSLGLCPELQFTLQELGYHQPTPIQEAAIPMVLEGHDLIAEAQTGTGKTASFALPMIEQLSRQPQGPEYYPIRGLVLVPTRELAIQVADATLAYGLALGMRVISIYGGVRFDNQIRKMKRGADILVATPGRLLEMLRQKKFTLDHLEFLVLDEADRMLDLGFIHDLRAILSFTPAQKQTLLFSATFTPAVEKLTDGLLNAPERVSVAPRNATSKKVTQHAFAIDNRDKTDILSYLITGCGWQQTLVFARTKRRAEQVSQALQKEGIKAVSIHGDKNQRERSAALAAFTAGEATALIATDVAARGLDIEGLPRVINYDIPQQAEAYVHRIGRTGRAGQTGIAFSFCSPDEKALWADIGQLIGKQIPLQPVPLVENGKLVMQSAPPAPRRGQKNRRPKPHKAANKPAAKGKAQNTNKPTRQKPAADTKPAKKPGARRSLFK